jgi:hypothetical protein
VQSRAAIKLRQPCGGTENNAGEKGEFSAQKTVTFLFFDIILSARRNLHWFSQYLLDIFFSFLRPLENFEKEVDFGFLFFRNCLYLLSERERPPGEISHTGFLTWNANLQTDVYRSRYCSLSLSPFRIFFFFYDLRTHTCKQIFCTPITTTRPRFANFFCIFFYSHPRRNKFA